MSMKTLPQLSVVLGGANSGKSVFAESLVESTVSPLVYLATAQAWDDEMAAKIQAHIARRGPRWHTIEAPLDLGAALEGVSADSVVLLDCVTMWLSNHLLAQSDCRAQCGELLAALKRCAAPVVVVTNEVGWSVVPETSLGRAFRRHQGRLNQDLAAQADLAVLVAAGLPMVLKGALP